MGLGVLHRHGQGGAEQVGGHHRGQRAFAGDGQGDGAAAGAQVGDARHVLGRQPCQCLFHQQLGLRARYQGGDVDLQVQGPEAAAAGEVGQRVAFGSALQQQFEALAGVVVHRVGGVGEQPGAVHAQHVQQQLFGLVPGVLAGQLGGAFPQQRGNLGGGHFTTSSRDVSGTGRIVTRPAAAYRGRAGPGSSLPMPPVQALASRWLGKPEKRPISGSGPAGGAGSIVNLY